MRRFREIVPARALLTARGSAVLLGLAAAAVDVYVFVTNLDQGIINAFVVSTVLGFAAMLAAWVVAHAARVEFRRTRGDYPVSAEERSG